MASKIKDLTELPRIVSATSVGKTVAIKLSRNGAVATKEVKLGEMEEKTEIVKASSRKKNWDNNPRRHTPDSRRT